MNATPQSRNTGSYMLLCILRTLKTQKVQLVFDIFNEKTVVALEEGNLLDMTIFVKMVTKLWNMINIKITLRWIKNE